MSEFFYKLFFKEEFEPRVWTFGIVIAGQIAVTLTILGGIVYVVHHFIVKYW